MDREQRSVQSSAEDYYRLSDELSWRRRYRLTVLAHLWVCVPLFAFWLGYAPGRTENSPEVLHSLATALVLFVLYLGLRTALAWRGAYDLRGDRVFAVLDVALVSVAIYLRNDPLSALHYAYLIPIAEAVGTLNVRWMGTVSVLAALGYLTAVAAVGGAIGSGTIIFRVVFVILLGSLLTFIAGQVAELRAQARVAGDRERIALEMHDGLQGQLTVIASQLELARHLASTSVERTEHTIETCRQVAREAADGLRFLVHRLRVPELELGFVAALRQYLHHLEGRAPFVIRLDVEGEEYALAPETEHALFRIFQEALNNVFKHAGASAVLVHLEFGPDAVTVAVEDNGRGFDTSHCSSEPGVGGLGQASMRARAEKVGAVLRVESEIGQGTHLTVTVPRRVPTAPERVRRLLGSDLVSIVAARPALSCGALFTLNLSLCSLLGVVNGNPDPAAIASWAALETLTEILLFFFIFGDRFR